MPSLCSYTQNNNYCSVVYPKYATVLASFLKDFILLQNLSKYF
jgi:hypothetical protein